MPPARGSLLADTDTDTDTKGNGMDLGIRGKTALVCASSKGLGRGCAEALAAEGVDLVINARTAETLERTATEIADRHGDRLGDLLEARPLHGLLAELVLRDGDRRDAEHVGQLADRDAPFFASQPDPGSDHAVANGAAHDALLKMR